MASLRMRCQVKEVGSTCQVEWRAWEAWRVQRAPGRWGGAAVQGVGRAGEAERVDAGWAAAAKAGEQQSRDPGKGTALQGPAGGSKFPSPPLCTCVTALLAGFQAVHSAVTGRRMGLHPSPTPTWCHCLVLGCSYRSQGVGNAFQAHVAGRGQGEGEEEGEEEEGGTVVCKRPLWGSSARPPEHWLVLPPSPLGRPPAWPRQGRSPWSLDHWITGFQGRLRLGASSETPGLIR